MTAAQTDYMISSPDVIVDAEGFIHVHLLDVTTMAPLDEVCKLAPKAAIELATALAQGVQMSIDRTQIGNPHYYDSERIIARMESPLGRAISALKKVYGR